ncbi:MAG: hypothetical protein B7Z68_09230 [Acidobacteria bacterium 21-70-11]|nr:MAG: hypothetical protein B7Z68_09230 [Acidobacteria bacterium 21-70-11]
MAAGRSRALPLLVAALLATPLAAAVEVPFLSGHVNDTAAMIPAGVREQIETKLAAFEKTKGAQVVVLTVPSLNGEPIEDYSIKVAQTWKLGRKGVDDGVLFLVARDDRRMRIEVGYGLEAKLTDAQCGRILDDVVRPAFRSGDFGGGVEAGVEAITGTIEGKAVIPAPPPLRPRSLAAAPLPVRLFGTLMFVVVIGVFSAVALFGKGCMSWFLYVFLMPFYAAFPAGLWGAPGALAIPLWVLGFPLAKLVLAKTGAGKSFMAAHPGIVTFATSSGRSGSGGGFSGGGFSGGGGSFGGGGSSGSW